MKTKSSHEFASEIDKLIYEISYDEARLIVSRTELLLFLNLPIVHKMIKEPRAGYVIALKAKSLASQYLELTDTSAKEKLLGEINQIFTQIEEFATNYSNLVGDLSSFVMDITVVILIVTISVFIIINLILSFIISRSIKKSMNFFKKFPIYSFRSANSGIHVFKTSGLYFPHFN